MPPTSPTAPLRDVLAWVRWLPLVVVPVLLLVSDYPGRYQVPWTYWLAALAAAVVFLFGGRWPLPVSVSLSALAVPMFAAHSWGLSGLVPYLGAVGLAEVAMRTHRPASIAVATGCWAAAVLLGIGSETYTTFWRAATAVQALAYVGLPLLVGLYLRAQRDLAVTYRAQAAEAESRRAEATVRARAAEREALARELHDLVAHHMASIVLRISVARHVVDEADPRVRAVLDDVYGTASGALADIRRLLVALRDPALGEVALVEPDAVPVEIAAAVERARAAGFAVAAEVDPDPGPLDTIGRLTLLRVVQESLTNVMKHADPAGEVDVVVTRRGAGVAVRVASSWRADDPPNPDGHGVVGMQERVALVGGTLEVGALDVGATGSTWRVEAWIPGAAPGGGAAR
ncbi:sensor histidine kinase [Speluncibacter jeojiensis]|uniref:histidine kinase n=1 Tax=Speluncibacter jeojiensis TaxID=2710754 RepID=A0A9X4RC14_9ACTN|nr:histidine kinase [Corynebacteriales bacterium D3-21]